MAERIPTVVVDDLHVTYKVHGTHADRGNTTTSLSRLLTRRISPRMREVHGLRGVSFAAYKGEAIGVIGSNGSGKSTLLLAIAGLLPPSQGKVYTDGQPTLLGVNAALMNDLTGERNVVLGCLAGGMTRAEVAERYDDIVAFSGVNDNGDFISLPMRTYSSGMSARLRFSIAAAKTHDVLLVDEALSTGDAEFRRRSEAAHPRTAPGSRDGLPGQPFPRRGAGIVRAHDLAGARTHRCRRGLRGGHRCLRRPARSAGARATVGRRPQPVKLHLRAPAVVGSPRSGRPGWVA